MKKLENIVDTFGPTETKNEDILDTVFKFYLVSQNA